MAQNTSHEHGGRGCNIEALAEQCRLRAGIVLEFDADTPAEIVGPLFMFAAAALELLPVALIVLPRGHPHGRALSCDERCRARALAETALDLAEPLAERLLGNMDETR